MNFWEKQRRSKSKTKSYVALFCLAVLGIIVLVNAVIFFTFPHITGVPLEGGYSLGSVKLKIVLITSLITIIIVGVSSLIKSLQLSSGGKSIAKMMGARELDESETSKERVFRNVVEEISIASGVTVPAIYIMDRELSINAFVAGHDTSDCIICVTKGSLDLLTRDELQAMVAHEYGHVFNGDMKLNMKLISTLFGILVIGEIGRILMRGNRYRSSSSRRKSGGQLAFLGFAIFAVGYIGHFFASLIQARISREREFLADACSVQYTRNPESLISLFKKIYVQGKSWITTTESKQIAHMFFSSGLDLSSMMATHPPLMDRIESIDSKFDRDKFENIEAREFQNQVFDKKWEEIEKKRAHGHLATKGFSAGSLESEAVLARVGSIDDASLHNGRNILNDLIPLELREFFYRKKDCVHVILALFIDEANYEERQKQLTILKEKESVDFKKVKTIFEGILKLPNKVRVSIIECCAPALKRLNSNQQNELLENIDLLVKVDSKVLVKEFLMQEVIENILNPLKKNKEYKRGSKLEHLQDELSMLFSFLNIISHSDKEDAKNSFLVSQEQLGINISKLKKKDISYKKVQSSLRSLQHLEIEENELLIKALVKGVLSDNVIVPVELMCLKMICLVLKIPFPQID